MYKTAKELNNELKKSKLSQEYFSLKENILKDKNIQELLNVIQSTQKEVKDALKNNDLETYKIKTKSLEILKEEFINQPLINNYIIAKHDLYELLEQIVNILSFD